MDGENNGKPYWKFRKHPTMKLPCPSPAVFFAAAKNKLQPKVARDKSGRKADGLQSCQATLDGSKSDQFGSLKENPQPDDLPWLLGVLLRFSFFSAKQVCKMKNQIQIL